MLDSDSGFCVALAGCLWVGLLTLFGSCSLFPVHHRSSQVNSDEHTLEHCVCQDLF